MKPSKVVWVLQTGSPSGNDLPEMYLHKVDALREARAACATTGSYVWATTATVTRYVRDDTAKVARVKA